MAGEVDAFGQMATAGLAASALDPPRDRLGAGVRRRGALRRPVAEPRHRDDLAHGACANCGTVLTGPFCATCGQSAHVHRSIGHILEEFLHGLWHFDSKTWKTLPRLTFRPGTLTREYVYGKRAGYIAPLGLFLFSIFLMFFVFGLLGGPDVNGALAAAGGQPVADARSAVADAQEAVRDAQGEVSDAKGDSDTTPAELARLTAALAAEQARLTAAQTALTAIEKAPPAAAVKAPAKRWQDELAEAARTGKGFIHTGSPRIDGRIRAALQNPDFAIYRIEDKAYKLSFLLVPMSLPTLWLLFLFRRGVHTYDHVVFALYSLSFMSLLFIVIALASRFDPTAGAHTSGDSTNFSGGIGGILLFAIPVHMFAQLKGAYRLTAWGALWRTFVLAIASATTLSIFAVLIVVAGLAD